MDTRITQYICPVGVTPTEQDKQDIKDNYINALTNVVITNEELHGNTEDCFFQL